jgi:hypothetical protein
MRSTMSLTKDQIRDAALQLEPTEKQALAEELLLSISDHDRQSIDAAWLAEARGRDAAFSSGKTSATPSDEVVERLQRKASA